jgi:hypothetical protein
MPMWDLKVSNIHVSNPKTKYRQSNLFCDNRIQHSHSIEKIKNLLKGGMWEGFLSKSLTEIFSYTFWSDILWSTDHVG